MTDITRLNALIEVGKKMDGLSKYLDGGYLKEQNEMHPIDVLAQGDDPEELTDLVNVVENFAGWINGQILEEEEKDTEIMPFQG